MCGSLSQQLATSYKFLLLPNFLKSVYEIPQKPLSSIPFFLATSTEKKLVA